MNRALIGFTGFVGGNILAQTKMNSLYNSINISDIRNRKFDLLVCAGIRAEKWKANQNPQNDLENVSNLIDNLKSVKASKFIHISTVDVYSNLIGVRESSIIDRSSLAPYGKHRLLFEEFVKSNFANVIIVRLPGLFGKGLKKNFIYDLIHNNVMDYTHKDSQFQFYNLSKIWNDIKIAMDNHLSLVNLVSPPILASDLAEKCFGVKFTNVTEKPPIKYDIQTKYSKLFDSRGNYLGTKKIILDDIKEFAGENIHI